MLGFKALRAVVADLHGEGVAPTSLLGRFKYLQRMGFPGGSNVGSGARAEYDLGQVLALALAFEMQETAASPVRVVRLLRHRWPDLERAVCATWAALEGLGGAPMLLAHAPGALAEMGLPDDEDRPPVDPLEIVPRERVAAWIEGASAVGGPSLYVIDLGRLVLRVGVALVASGGVPVGDLRERFLELGGTVFGTGDARRWLPEAVDAVTAAAAGSGPDRGRESLGG